MSKSVSPGQPLYRFLTGETAAKVSDAVLIWTVTQSTEASLPACASQSHCYIRFQDASRSVRRSSALVHREHGIRQSPGAMHPV
jgi:hypothetical protein